MINFVRTNLSLTCTPEEAIESLRTSDTLHLPCASATLCERVAKELRGIAYARQMSVTPSLIEQEFEHGIEVPPDSLTKHAFKVLGEMISDLFAEAKHYPFWNPLRLSEEIVQRYAPGPRGITPHRDCKKYINLVATLTIAGSRTFGICSTKDKKDARTLRLRPGDLVLMRGSGFLGEKRQPLHFVEEIEGEGVVLISRQVREA